MYVGCSVHLQPPQYTSPVGLGEARYPLCSMLCASAIFNSGYGHALRACNDTQRSNWLRFLYEHKNKLSLYDLEILMEMRVPSLPRQVHMRKTKLEREHSGYSA